jgi:hypothetical protein
MLSGSGEQLYSVLPRFALESGKFALLTPTIKFFVAPGWKDFARVVAATKQVSRTMDPQPGR